MGRRVTGADPNIRKTHEIRGHRGWNDKRSLGHDKNRLVLGPVTAADFPTPRWMTAEEKEMFEQLRDIVVEGNIANRTDALALAMLATAYTDYIELSQEIARTGRLVEYTLSNGAINQKENPLLNLRTKAFQNAKSLLTEFGLTPSSRRTVVKADTEKADNSDEEEWDALLN